MMGLFSFDIFKNKKENVEITQAQFQSAMEAYEEMQAKTKYVQAKLAEFGFYGGEIDGLWGVLTDEAIREFQKSRGLAVDGIVGSKTLEELNREPQVENFKDYEFICKCDGRFCNGLPSEGIDREFLLMLEEVRRRNGDKPIIIRSGYRCPEWNRRVGGARASQHMSDPLWCADILSPGVSPKALEKICDEVFADGGVGLNGATIVHVDKRGHRARWYYS
jgi:zinc D-Ala-D-Ala carboxypeptidase